MAYENSKQIPLSLQAFLHLLLRHAESDGGILDRESPDWISSEKA